MQALYDYDEKIQDVSWVYWKFGVREVGNTM